MNVHEIFGGVGLGTSNNESHVSINPDPDHARAVVNAPNSHHNSHSEIFTLAKINEPIEYVLFIHSFINTHKAAENKKHNKKQYIKTIHKSKSKKKLKHAHTYH